ncbi:RICIN domain-containing protein [Krasilnikovia sp. MM14-A1004]|uniref:RICIN domain-containing protein n=1 Tax=Krasilnikovia sp. MM14-A1004 TaxID=3373541 RepID=UPI00399D55DD
MAFVATIASAAIFSATPASAAVVDSGPWEIRPYANSTKCVEIPNGSKSDSTVADLWSCASAALPNNTGGITPLWHRWIWRKMSSGYFEIINGNSGKCLNVPGGSLNNSVKIIQYTCTTDSSSAKNDRWEQVWVKNANGYSWYEIVNQNSHKCLNLPNGANANGTQLIQYTCGAGASNEIFTWVPAKQV